MIYGTPTIVTNGLVLALDAANSLSIPVDPTVNQVLWSQNFSQSAWSKSILLYLLNLVILEQMEQQLHILYIQKKVQLLLEVSY